MTLGLAGGLVIPLTPATTSVPVEPAVLATSTVETTLSETTEGRLFFPDVVIPDRKVKATLTAYSSTPDQTDSDPFTAASGKRVFDGMIAANGLPFGTKIKIPELFGDKVFVVEDRMNARYGFGRFDIWMDAPRHVVNAFGVKRATVEIYYPGSKATAKALAAARTRTTSTVAQKDLARK